MPSLFTGVASAGVVLSMKPWKGASKLKAAKDSKGYGDMPKVSLEGRLGQVSVAGVGLKSCTGVFSDSSTVQEYTETLWTVGKWRCRIFDMQ